MIQSRISALREKMREREISVYVVPTADFHESEYVGDYFKAREYMTGFTGSAGTFVLTMTEAGLWTDGRYFVQAAQELKDSGITLQRMGEEGVPTVDAFIEQTLEENGNIGFDGRVVNAGWGKRLEKIAQKKNGHLIVNVDLVGEIWESRPAMAKSKATLLDLRYSGKSTKEKLGEIRTKMEEENADVHLISSLCDIAWILNIRGQDISHVPVVLSFLVLTKTECIWFVQKEALTEEVRGYLKENEILTREYDEFYPYVTTLQSQRILLDLSMVNYRLMNDLPESAHIIDKSNPSEWMKAVKNPTEIENIKKAHVKDAVAMCRFMYWLKTNVGKKEMTELSVSEYLTSLREKQEGYLELSFETICGYDFHGAIVHYSVSEESDISIEPRGFLLVDSGAHYLEGTTDITRTFALGPLTEEMRRDYTMVCRSNLNLAAVKFLYGCSGRNLDVIARQPFWDEGLDYKHGTGHGVGYILNVHEGPNSFRYQMPKTQAGECVLEEGMVTTDEPGIYKEGEYGIRLENELVCVKKEKTEYGQFMGFEPITYVPFDLDAIDASRMSELEKKRLNDYHAMVYEVVSPYLNEEEAKWLLSATRRI